MTTSRLETLVAQLEEVEAVKTRLKERSMIFQADAKEYAALLAGLPLDAYYHLPFAEWMKVSGELAADRAAQADHSENVAIFFGLEMDAFDSVPFESWRWYWETYKAEGLAEDVSQEQRDAAHARIMERAWAHIFDK